MKMLTTTTYVSVYYCQCSGSLPTYTTPNINFHWVFYYEPDPPLFLALLT